MTPRIDTAKVLEYRKLHFRSIDEVLAEIDRIVASEKSGQLETTGNWTGGQILSHLAAWIDYGYEGYPIGPPPWFIRFFLKWMAKSYLKNGMPRGVQIPGTPEGTYGAEMISTEEGADRLRKSFLRLKSGEACPIDSPAFGPMSHEDRIQLNLRHAELHMGYFRY